MELETFFNEHVDKTYNWPETFTNTIPYLPLNIDGPWKAILEEIKRVDHLFVKHRDDGYSSGWSSLCLHGLCLTCTDADSIYPELAGTDKHWTELADMCPIAADYFKTTFPYTAYDRLRFMRLAPGGYITPHNDGDGVHFEIAAINISLNNPDECKMVMENIGTVPFKDSGTVMAFNNAYNHCVWNRSDEPRYHMIVHGAPHWQFSNIMQQSYRQYIAQNTQ